MPPFGVYFVVPEVFTCSLDQSYTHNHVLQISMEVSYAPVDIYFTFTGILTCAPDRSYAPKHVL